MVEWCLGGSGF